MRGRTESWTPRNRTNRPGKTSHMASIEEEKASISTPHDQPRANSRINNNYCVTKLQARLLAGSPLPTETIDSRINVNYSVTKLQARLLAGSPLPTETIDTCSFLNAKPHVVLNVHTALGHSQKRELSPGSAGCYYKDCKLKSGKSFLCHSIFLCSTCNKCQKCCLKSACRGQTWLDQGTGPKIVQMLKEGCSLPFQIQPNLTRSPTVITCYVNPHRNSYLLEALHQLIDKNAVELVHNPTSLGFFNRLFLVPKPNNKWRPILDLSKLNLFLKVEKFKMETPETIRTSLQQGEWVTSVDFKDAYFHIPIQEQSRKYLKFHVQGSDVPIQSTAFWSVHSTHGVHCVSKGGETDGHTQGYKNPPIPR